MANYKWQQIPGLIISKNGRRRLWNSAIYRLKFLIIPIAHLYRKYLIRHVKVIAVVGSFGKTTTTRAIAAALGLSPEKHRGNNNGVFLAAGLLNIPPWAHAGVLEVGISMKGQMAENAKLIQPNIVAVTCIGSEHGTSLGGLDNTREEKAMMVRALPKNGIAVLNGDDPHVKQMANYTNARVIMQGYAEANDFKAQFIKASLHDGSLYHIQDGDVSYDVATPLFGRATILSIMAAVIVAREFGISEGLAIKRLRNLSPALERLELMKTSLGAHVLVDSGKSALETVELALETLEDLPASRKVVILGEVEEPHESLGPLYRRIGEHVANIASHLLFIGSKRVKRPLFNGAKKAGMQSDNLFYFGHSINMAIEQALHLVKPGDLVLIKGRSSQKLARIALALMEKSVLCNRETCRQKFNCIQCDQLNKNTYENQMGKGYNYRADKANSGGWLT